MAGTSGGWVCRGIAPSPTPFRTTTKHIPGLSFLIIKHNVPDCSVWALRWLNGATRCLQTLSFSCHARPGPGSPSLVPGTHSISRKEYFRVAPVVSGFFSKLAPRSRSSITPASCSLFQRFRPNVPVMRPDPVQNQDSEPHCPAPPPHPLSRTLSACLLPGYHTGNTKSLDWPDSRPRKYLELSPKGFWATCRLTWDEHCGEGPVTLTQSGSQQLMCKMTRA